MVIKALYRLGKKGNLLNSTETSQQTLCTQWWEIGSISFEVRIQKPVLTAASPTHPGGLSKHQKENIKHSRKIGNFFKVAVY